MTDQQTQSAPPGHAVMDGRLALTGAGAIASALNQHRVGYSALRGVRKLVPSASRTVDEGIANAVGSLLDIDLGDAFLGCWRRYEKVTGAMRRTAADPNSEEIVVLDRHRISSTYRPRVSLSVDEVRVHTFEFELSLVNDIVAVAVQVNGGHVSAARGGSCHTVAKLVLDGFVVQEWQRDFDLGLVVRLPAATSGPAGSTLPTVPEQAGGRRQGLPPGDGQGANALR